MGRKKVELDLTQIQLMRNDGIVLRDIAQHFNSSPQTIMRRLQEVRRLP